MKLLKKPLSIFLAMMKMCIRDSNRKESAVEGRIGDWGEVVTR